MGRHVLRSSGAIIRLAMIRLRWGQWARAVIGQALMGIPPITAVVAGTISGIGIRYPAPAGSDRRVGTRVPNIPLRPGRLYDALRGGRFVLLGTDAARLDLPPQVNAAVPARPAGQLRLVRPDGYLAWVDTADQFPAWAGEYFQKQSAQSP